MRRFGRILRALVAAIAVRARALEAIVGVILLVAGVFYTYSLGAALIVAGVALLTPIVWPELTELRRR